MHARDFGYSSARAYMRTMECRYERLPPQVWDTYEAMLRAEVSEQREREIADGGPRADELLAEIGQ